MAFTCYNCFQTKPTGDVCPFCGHNPETEKKYPLALWEGSILNGCYTVGRVLGQGGFGITYLAQDFNSKEKVAIKEYLPAEFAGRTQGNSVQAFSDDQQENYEYGKQQFLSEAKTLAAFIGDEHIVRIYSYFEENNTAYFVMEYVDGCALDKYMAQKGGRLSVDEANRLLLPLMQSLDKVHAKGIVHRDIAPDNIIITRDGTAKLIDFGAARYSTGEKSKSLDVILKHGFAPKEQYLRRGRQGPFTDVYALAATYYYAITGKVPPESIERIDDDNLIPPSSLGMKISDRTEDALFKALEINAPNRYQSMREFYAAMAGADPGVQPQSDIPKPEGSAAHSKQVADEKQDRPEQSTGELRAEEEQRKRERLEREAKEKAARQEQERKEREAREEAARLEREREEQAEREAREAREAEEQLAAEREMQASVAERREETGAAGRKAGPKRKLLILILMVLAVVLYLVSYSVSKKYALQGEFSQADRLLLVPGITRLHDRYLERYIAAGLEYEQGHYSSAAQKFYPLIAEDYLRAEEMYNQAKDLEYQSKLANK